MKYILSWQNASSRYIQIEAHCEGIQSEKIEIQLPSWRPGRYELGNFAKNVRQFRVTDEEGRSIPFQKITKDRWVADTKGVKGIRVYYEYFANDLNAGSTFLDETQLYVNPVNCMVYVVGRENDSCDVQLMIPENWKVACAMKKKDRNVLTAPNFDRLADSPFIASPTLKHNYFILDGVEFHLWFQGEFRPDWSRLITDFFIFVNENMQVFGSFPSEEYHFLFQILPVKFYHGVEHVDSTVIALGPTYRVMRDLYHDLLGVSCHELFHAWNIKTIRPAEMQPYDLTKENYSRQGFVAEGVTTYYGDYLLFRSGIWNAEEYWPTFNERLQKHFETHARFFHSVADSSFDTWLDGYVPGAPHRKTSIYHEGCLLAFVTDMFIRRNTGNQKSLDDVMRRLWTEFAKAGRGYTEADFKKLIEEEAGKDFSFYWNNYFYKANDYTAILQEALSYIGHEIEFRLSSRIHERVYGFRVSEAGGITRVTEIYYNSPAEKGGLALGDEVMLVNGMQVKNDLNEWMRYFEGETLSLKVSSGGIVRDIFLRSDGEHYYSMPVVVSSDSPTQEQQSFYQNWSRKPW